MASFKHKKFPQLSFYVEGIRYKFRNGIFRTNDQKVINEVSKLSGVVRLDQPKVKQEEKKEEPTQTPSKLKSKKAK